MENSALRFRLFAPFLLVALWLAGCESGCISERTGSLISANPDRAVAEIQNMNPRELELCPTRPGQPPLSSSTSSGESIGGGINTANAQNDASSWQAAQDKARQIFGDDDPGPADTGSNGGAANAPIEPANGITNIAIQGTDRNAYPRIDVTSSRSATMFTTGFARVTRNVQTRRGPRPNTQDSVLVRIAYSLSKVNNNWRCTTAYADPVQTLGSPGSPGGGDRFGNRIGW